MIQFAAKSNSPIQNPDLGREAPRTARLTLVRETTPAYGAASPCCPDHGPRAPGPGDEATLDPHLSAVAPTPDPFTDADNLEELEEEIAVLAAHIHAATHRLLTLIAEFDRRRGWELGGHRSCAHWLSARTGIDLGTAREKVRTARALVGLPETGASMARGELSFSKVRALTRVATPENEGDLLELAWGCTTSQLERMVRGYRRGSREDEALLEKQRHESRTFSVFPDDDGMYVVKGRLPAEVGALLMRAVEAASDALYRENPWPPPKADPERVAAQQRADAVGLLAERALAAGFGNGVEDDRGEGGEPTADGSTGESKPIPISGARAERYQVVLHVEPKTLRKEEDTGAGTAGAEHEPSRSHLEDGTRVSPETSRRLSCDASVIPIRHGEDSSILDVGRKTRTIPPALRRALDARDQGCRFPGCGLRFTEAHHLKHWADGGETSLENCVLLCRYHHRLMHEEGWLADWWGPGRAVFYDPRGGAHSDGSWHPPKLEEESPVEALIEDTRARGADPDGLTAGVRWKREADIPDRVFFRALEALNEVEL